VRFPALSARKSARSAESNGSIHTDSVGAASSFAPHCLQQPIVGKVWQKYTLNISRLLKVLGPPKRSPQICPHLPCLSSVRCCVTRRACHPNKSVPAQIEEQDFLLPK